MENRRKFYSSGKWGTFDLSKRYDCVCKALDAYKNGILDLQDLKFILKNAFVSKIYVSEGVTSAYPKYSCLFGNLSNLYDDLVGKGVLDLQDHSPNLSCKYLELCELGTMVNMLKRKGLIGSDKPSIRIEHVVPGNEYFPDVENIKSFQDFIDIFNVVSICLVTDEEDERLSKKRPKRNGKGDYTLVSKMPEGYEDYIVFPFARYDPVLGAGIVLHGWKIDNGKLYKQP